MPISKHATDVGLAVLAGSAVLGTLIAYLTPSPAPPPAIDVAFVGNSMLFVNDMPRFLEELSQGSIYQDSCFHGSLTFKRLLQKGNGMYHKWTTKNAEIEEGIYDYGACSVPQLLLGSDENLSMENWNGAFTDDGKNPCFQDNDYFRYRYYQTDQTTWDFVVLNDQSRQPAVESAREYSLEVLGSTYVNYFLQNGATPVLVATHGYEAVNENTTASMGDVATFTSNVYEGYRQYASLLAQYLPSSQAPRIAPTGLAFLYIYEDDPDMWKRLFYIDGFHPSPHGSYLMGLVLYATLYGKMPPPHSAFALNRLWSRARKMEIGSKAHMARPTYKEASYLFSVAQKIALKGKLPSTLVLYNDYDDDGSTS